MKANAIQKDVLKDDIETETEVKASPNPRNAFMEQIAAANAELMLEENGFETTGLDDAPETKEQGETKPAQDKQDELSHKLVNEDELANLTVRTKVNGIEEEVALSEVVKSYQKDSSASKKLEQASLRLKEIEQRERNLEEKESHLQSIQKSSIEQPSENEDAILDEAVSALYEGDEAKTKLALKKLVGIGRNEATQQTPAINMQDITSAVEQTLANKNAMKEFGKNFSEIVQDPFLRNVADTYLDAELQDGTLDLATALQNAGQSTREWMKSQAQAMGLSTVEEVTKRVDTKKQLKEGIDNVRVATNKPSSNSGDETEPLVSSVVAEMRKARGQPY